ncbi:hypothetical protein ACFGVS_02730 [Mucilaginibacter sp. AW1-7]|uniref:hypothetical protein n=1 Tax=Mucilaginibacter sp. AW1-7 TaxID=3349874 RepID=UPI003F7357EF
MTSKQLIQKTRSFKNEVHIKNGHLAVKKKAINEELEYLIKFEELGFEIVKKVDKSSNNAFNVLLIFNAISVYGITRGVYKHYDLGNLLIQCFCFALFVFLSFYAFRRRNKEIIYLSGGSKVLELLAAEPDKETVSTFIEEVHDAIRTYYKNKYTNFDEGMPYEDKVSILKWLKEIGSITDKEFDQLITTRKAENIIGFNCKDNNYLQ